MNGNSRNNVERLPPLDSRELEESIRRAVESASGQSYKQITELRKQLDLYARADRPQIVTVDTASKLPAPQRGALALTVDDQGLYGADGELWFPVGGGGGGGGGMVEHELFGEFHTGALDPSQAPWALSGVLVGGAGLYFADNALHVGAGAGILVNPDTIAIDPGIAGAGLYFVDSQFHIGVSNIGAEALDVSTDTLFFTSSFNPLDEARVLATDPNGSLYLGVDLLFVDNPNKRVGINREPLGAALDIVVSNDADHTQRIKQKSGQTGRMWKVEGVGGEELISLTNAGDLQSGNPVFNSGFTGWRITHTGIAEFAHAWIRGELHASIFVMDEFHSSGGTLYVAPAGKLENDAPLDDETVDLQPMNVRSTAFVEEVLSVRSTAFSETVLTSRLIDNWIEITDPPSGHAMVFSIGDRLRCKTLAMGVGIDIFDVWMIVTAIEDMTDFYRYHVYLVPGPFNDFFDFPTLPAGAAVINYRHKGDGFIVLTSDQQDAPYIAVAISGTDTPWAGETGDLILPLRMGKLNGVGLPGIGGYPDGNDDYGIVLGTNLADSTAPYFIASNHILKSYRIDSLWNNGISDTVSITANGVVKFGTNVGSPATTGFIFDSETGNLQIGSPSYPGSVTVYGQLYLPSGAPIQTMVWRGNWVTATSYLVQDAVYYNGSSWITDANHTSSAGNAPGVGSQWDILAAQGAQGNPGTGTPAKLVQIIASSQVFAVSPAGSPSPSSIVFSANGQNLSGAPSYAIVAGTGTLTGSGVTRTLTYANMTSESVTVRVTWESLTDEITVAKIYDGGDGVDALTVIVSNEAHTVPASSSGVVTSYAGSGTTIVVYEGLVPLDAIDTISGPGQFTIGTPAISPGGAITAGTRSYGTTTATVGNHSGMSSTVDTLTITYPITVRRLDGTNVTLSKVQTITKSEAGATGPIGPPGEGGSNAKLVKIIASSQVFSVSIDGASAPVSITFSASGQNLTGSPVYSVVSGTATLTGSGSTRTLTYANLDSETARIRVTWDDMTDDITVAKVYDGLSALTIILSNEAHTLPASSAGVVSSYTGSGTTISVYEGAVALDAASSITIPSQFTIGAPVVSPAGAISVGARSYGATTATVSNHSGMSNSQNTLTITYPITIKRASGVNVTINKVQTITKSKAGATGPTGPPGDDNQDFDFLDDDLAALQARSAPAGLYLVNNFIGFYSGGPDGNFSSYINHLGDFKFGDPTSSTRVEYSKSANRLRGVSAGGTQQWYADGDDGMFYAGGGKVLLSTGGISIATGAATGFLPETRIGWNQNAVTGAERAYIGARRYGSGSSQTQLMLAAVGSATNAWGTIALRARKSGQEFPYTIDTEGATLLVTPENVYIGPAAGLKLGTAPEGESALETTVPSGELRAVSIRLASVSGMPAGIWIDDVPILDTTGADFIGDVTTEGNFIGPGHVVNGPTGVIGVNSRTTGSSWQIYNPNGTLRFFHSSSLTDVLTLSSTSVVSAAAVGIGTSPAATLALDVNGNTTVRGNLIVEDASFFAGTVTLVGATFEGGILKFTQVVTKPGTGAAPDVTPGQVWLFMTQGDESSKRTLWARGKGAGGTIAEFPIVQTGT